MRAYLVVPVLFLSFLNACGHASPPVSDSSEEGLREAQAQAAILGRDTTTRLVELDRRVANEFATPAEKRTARTSSSFPAEEERQLYLADVNLNRALEGFYSQAWQKRNGDGELRAALLHWTVLIRRALMQDFHTKVPGLEGDPDCAGDIVGDEMFLRYFDAVLAHNETHAVLALTDLARQSACLGVGQSKLLATVLASTFEELRAFLRLNGHEDLVPYVIQAGSAPLLLFYDVEKYRGPDSPLARWFRENRDILIEGVESGRQPSRWHALWLYDRRSGRLLGFKATPRPVDENDVNLARFFASITTPENLGDYGCSFAEMVQRGLGVHGYFCAGASCGRNVSGLTIDDGRRLPKRPTLELAGIEKTFDRAICGEGRDGPAEHGEGPKCGNDPGHNRGADTVRCITQQVVHAGTEGFQCLGETSGQCGTPVQSLVKDMEPQAFAGIKLGSDCAISSGMGDVKRAEWEKQRQEQIERRRRQREIVELEESIKRIKEAIKEDKAMVEAADKEANDDKLAYDKARAAAVAAGRNPDTDPKVQEAAAKAKASAARDTEVRTATNDTIVAAEAAKARAEKALKEKQDEEAKKQAEQKKAEEDKKKAANNNNKRCVRDDPNCGDDLCTGMSQSTRDTLACVQTALSGKSTDTGPVRTGICDPRVCDPIESNAGAKGNLACFDAMAKDPATATAKFCWATRCVQGQVPVTGPNGCSCREGGGMEQSQLGGGGVNNFCTKMLCSEGTPSYRDGRCTCGGESSGSSGGKIPRSDFGGYTGSIPQQHPPVFGAPSTYTDVRYPLR